MLRERLTRKPDTPLGKGLALRTAKLGIPGSQKGIFAGDAPMAPTEPALADSGQAGTLANGRPLLRGISFIVLQLCVVLVELIVPPILRPLERRPWPGLDHGRNTTALLGLALRVHLALRQRKNGVVGNTQIKTPRHWPRGFQ